MPTHSLLWRLERALKQGRLVLHYQPKVDLVTGRVIAVEALIRWHDDRRGIVLPDEFVPALEDSRLVGPFNRYVLDMAVRQARDWQLQGLPVPVAVNLTAACLDDPALPGHVRRLLDERGLPPELLRLEITERAFTELGERAQGAMEHFAASGISVALDDFGVGHSSMARLVRLPVDVLKIDRAFVTPMATDDRSAVVVRAAIDIAHSLGLKAVAEGVETEQVWRRLRLLGCDWAQGYLISRPVPPEQLLPYLDPDRATPLRALVELTREPTPGERRAQTAENLAVRGMIDRLDWVAHAVTRRRPDELRRIAA
ncbi:MAG: EAL domain-containing protein, partial [Actinomycetota bacterium]|nr:EAL domain-containing protein [Actinomycetota bacterium]